MNLRKMSFMLAISAALTGCTSERVPVASIAASDAVRETAANTVTLDDVLHAVQSHGLRLLQIQPKGGTSLFGQLNDTPAVTFAIDSDKMEEPNNKKRQLSIKSIVNINIYVFDSEASRKEGRKALDDKLQLVKLISAPMIYANKNVLVIHFKHPDEKAEYDQMIDSAVQSL